jgi:error-prone DNA polymerase
MLPFRRRLPPGPEYESRLKHELELIQRFGFANVFSQVREILDLADDIPHITRGSAGSSLVCYLMGITDFDPIQHGFCLARFMHERRQDLPDIDIDFPYNRRDEVIERVKEKYPGRVARISTKIRYRRDSAIRQALREAGFHHFLPRGFDLEKIAGDKAEAILRRAGELEGTVRLNAQHCGGIVIFDDHVPPDLKIKDDHIHLDKDEVEAAGLHKIDLLCNRGLAQWTALATRPLLDYPEEDDDTVRLFNEGDTWGVTFAESPAQRKLCGALSVRCRSDIITALALIRPVPSADGRKLDALETWRQTRSTKGHLVFDEDGINLIRELLICSESEAEVYRRGFAKEDENTIKDFAVRIQYLPDWPKIVKELSYYALYSFCKAHATAYGYLVWALAYEKTRQRQKFWLAALNHAASMYRPWVHVQEAKYEGLKLENFGQGGFWHLEGDRLTNSKPDKTQGDGWHQYRKRNYWISNRFMPNCYFDGRRFRGLIATGRHHTVGGREITFLTIGFKTGHYLDLTCRGLLAYDAWDGVEGEGHRQGESFTVTKIEGWRA